MIKVNLRACDVSLGTGAAACNVIHSFWVPELAGKTDVVPGHDNWMKFEATKPGTYLGQCAEYCGLSHANMRFRVIAQTPSDFADWLAGQREGPATPLDAGRRGRRPVHDEVRVHELPHDVGFEHHQRTART